jgi:hypothetical protein
VFAYGQCGAEEIPEKLRRFFFSAASQWRAAAQNTDIGLSTIIVTFASITTTYSKYRGAHIFLIQAGL